MLDFDHVYTKRGTPIITVFTRIAFAGYFIFAYLTAFGLIPSPPTSRLEPLWVTYVGVIYLAAEYLYRVYRRRGIDLTVAQPLVFAVVCLNAVTELLGGQDTLPQLNRAEHFAGFVLITYIIWLFFIRYLPHEVWSEHPYYTALLVLAVTSMFGVCNEIIELFFDHFFHTSHIGEKTDTALDLLMNTLGSITFLSVRLLIGSPEKSDTA